LIPNVQKPQELNEYRPISLVDGVYKIIAKNFSNRLKKVLHKVLSYKHTTFTKGKWLMDSIVVANEGWMELEGKAKVW